MPTVQASDFETNVLPSGTVFVSNAKIAINLPNVASTSPYPFYGDVQFKLRLKDGTSSGEVLGLTRTFTIQDSSIFNNSNSDVNSVAEGSSVTFYVYTSRTQNGTLYYTTTGNVNYNDFVGGNVGSFSLTNNYGSFTLQANADLSTLVERGERFAVQIRSGSTSGTVIGTSEYVDIIDSSNVTTVDSLSISPTSIFETEKSTLTVNTINGLGNAGATLYYTLLGNASIFGSTSGSIIINNDAGQINIIPEGGFAVQSGEETYFAVQVRQGSTNGTILATSSNVYVADIGTSLAANAQISSIKDITPSASSSIGRNQLITVLANLHNSTNGETIYYDTLGNVTSSSFVSGNTGSVTVTNGLANVQMTTSATYGGNFRIRLKRAADGIVLGQTDFLEPAAVLGGTVEVSGSTYTHIFTSSETAVIASPVPGAKVLVIAGGGSGMRAGNPAPIQGSGGGGGAGGMIIVPSVTIPAGEYNIVVGAGGVNGTPGSFNLANRGANTTAFGYIALGGGRGQATRNPGTPTELAIYQGGSAAGAGWISFGVAGETVQGGTGIQTVSTTIPADSRTYGYGGNGGAARDNNTTGGGGGGAGGNGTAYNAGGYGGSSRAVPWMPASYGISYAPRTFAGGGNGGGQTGTPAGQTARGTHAEANSGSGGGGNNGSAYFNGGSGIVAIQYTI